MAYITKRELAAVMRRHPTSVMRLVKQGVLPQPIKLNPDPCPCLFDDAEVATHLAAIAAKRQGNAGHDPAEVEGWLESLRDAVARLPAPKKKKRRRSRKSTNTAEQQPAQRGP